MASHLHINWLALAQVNTVSWIHKALSEWLLKPGLTTRFFSLFWPRYCCLMSSSSFSRSRSSFQRLRMMRARVCARARACVRVIFYCVHAFVPLCMCAIQIHQPHTTHTRARAHTHTHSHPLLVIRGLLAPPPAAATLLATAPVIPPPVPAGAEGALNNL